jgi:predicted NAD-dependent protein-ADP-ribosyltransferase YbiA (DUF1768 family)
VSFYEFYEPIVVDTPLGTGRAILIERTPQDYWWTVALDDSQAIVTFSQNKLRICRSYTHERGISDEQMKEIVRRE